MPARSESSSSHAKTRSAVSSGTLTGKQKSHLRGLGHALEPVVQMGKQGLTPAVLKEVDLALEAHELIKVKLPKESDQPSSAMGEEIQSQLGARIVQQIGHLLLLYRARQKDPRIVLPKAGA